MFMMVGACMPPGQVSDHGPRNETPPPIGGLGALFLHTVDPGPLCFQVMRPQHYGQSDIVLVQCDALPPQRISYEHATWSSSSRYPNMRHCRPCRHPCSCCKISASVLVRPRCWPAPDWRSGPGTGCAWSDGTARGSLHALETLPERIAALQREMARLNAELADLDLYARDPARFDAITKALGTTQNELAVAEEQWLALALLRQEIEG
jgi:hypothetical protein